MSGRRIVWTWTYHYHHGIFASSLFIFFYSLSEYLRLGVGIMFRAYIRGYGFDGKAHQQHNTDKHTRRRAFLFKCNDKWAQGGILGRGWVTLGFWPPFSGLRWDGFWIYPSVGDGKQLDERCSEEHLHNGLKQLLKLLFLSPFLACDSLVSRGWLDGRHQRRIGKSTNRDGTF
jgi:hypothetical protein